MFTLFNRGKTPQQNINRQNEYGYLGKTAFHADFIKHHINSREAIALDRWVKEGFSLASRRKLNAPDLDGNYGLPNLFFMAGNETETSLLGIIMPSADSSRRYYPFANFINIGQSLYRLHPAALFLNQSHYLTELMAVSDQVFSASGNAQMQRQAKQFTPIVNGLKQVTYLQALLEKFRQVPMSILWHEIGLTEVEDRATLIQESTTVMRAMASKGCLKNKTGLRFPMPTWGGHADLTAAFWLHLITVIVADHHWRPWVFYQLGTTQVKPSLTVFTTPLAPSYFTSIWHREFRAQSAIDLSQIAVSKKIGHASLALAKMDNVSMYDALRRWCKIEIS